MHPYPHTCTVVAAGTTAGNIPVSSAGLAVIESAPPPELDGPGGDWSPETLLVAAIADGFILTFRAVARGASCAWDGLECRVDGTRDVEVIERAA